jgi:hypothetical protein
MAAAAQNTDSLLKDALPIFADLLAEKQAAEVIKANKVQMIQDRLKCASRVIAYQNQHTTST